MALYQWVLTLQQIDLSQNDTQFFSWQNLVLTLQQIDLSQNLNESASS